MSQGHEVLRYNVLIVFQKEKSFFLKDHSDIEIIKVYVTYLGVMMTGPPHFSSNWTGWHVIESREITGKCLYTLSTGTYFYHVIVFFVNCNLQVS